MEGGEGGRRSGKSRGERGRRWRGMRRSEGASIKTGRKIKRWRPLCAFTAREREKQGTN